MVRLCPWDWHRCFLSCCGSVDSFGVVVVCLRHGNPSGYCLPRKVIVDGHFSIFDVWSRKLKGEVIVFG